MAGFADLISKKLTQFQNDLAGAQKKAMREGLKAGVKLYKNIAKPLIPVLGKSTEYRQKGTVKNNLRHRIKIKSKDGQLSGKGVIRIRRAGGKKMAAVSANTKDKTDPFYWFMLDRGTKKMKGAHFMEKAKNAGEARAINEAKNVYIATIQQSMAKWR